ncbi:MAG: hypothetical protein Q9224_006675 [Gallowayella concinna]
MSQALRSIAPTSRRLSSFTSNRQTSFSTVDKTTPLSTRKPVVLRGSRRTEGGLARLAKDENLSHSAGAAEDGLHFSSTRTLSSPKDPGMEQATARSRAYGDYRLIDNLTRAMYIHGIFCLDFRWMKAVVHRFRNGSGWGRAFQDSWNPWKYGSRQEKGTWQQKMAFSTSTRRHKPSPAAVSTPEPISIDQFHRLADEYIDNLVAQLEELQEQRRDVDCEYSVCFLDISATHYPTPSDPTLQAGVLKLDFPPAGTYVLNKQPPNRQIWLSSPISGPKRYDYLVIPLSSSHSQTGDASTGVDGAPGSEEGITRQEGKGEWIYLRDGSTLSGLLSEELGVEMEAGE